VRGSGGGGEGQRRWQGFGDHYADLRGRAVRAEGDAFFDRLSAFVAGLFHREWRALFESIARRRAVCDHWAEAQGSLWLLYAALKRRSSTAVRPRSCKHGHAHMVCALTLRRMVVRARSLRLAVRRYARMIVRGLWCAFRRAFLQLLDVSAFALGAEVD